MSIVSHNAVLSRILSSVAGAEKLIGNLAGPVVRIDVEAHVRSTIHVAGLPPFVVEESVAGHGGSDGSFELVPQLPHFSVDNGNAPSLSKAAGELVKTVQAQQALNSPVIP